MNWIEKIKTALHSLKPEQAPGDWAAMEALINNSPLLQPAKNKLPLWFKGLILSGVMALVAGFAFWPSQKLVDLKTYTPQPFVKKQVFQKNETPASFAAQAADTTSASFESTTIPSKNHARPTQRNSFQAQLKPAPAAMANGSAAFNKPSQNNAAHATATAPPQNNAAYTTATAPPQNNVVESRSEAASKRKRNANQTEVPVLLQEKGFAAPNLMAAQTTSPIGAVQTSKGWRFKNNWLLKSASLTSGIGSDRGVPNSTFNIQQELGVAAHKGNWRLQIGWGQAYHHLQYAQQEPAWWARGQIESATWRVDSNWQILGINQGAWRYDSAQLVQTDTFQIALPGGSQSLSEYVRSWHLPVRFGYFMHYKRFNFGAMAGVTYTRLQMRPQGFGEQQAPSQLIELWRFQLVPEIGYQLHPHWAIVLQGDYQWGTHNHQALQLGLRYQW